MVVDSNPIILLRSDSRQPVGRLGLQLPFEPDSETAVEYLFVGVAPKNARRLVDTDP